jgi:lambda repressor-like predicted transcriptional regulator
MALMLKAERKRGLSAADLAKQHGLSPTYIYTPKRLIS